MMITTQPSASRRRRSSSIVLVPALMALLAQGGDPARAADPAKIRVMTYNGAYTSMPVHVANDMGFYAKYNLDAELVVMNSGPAGVAALLGGSLDFIEPPTDQIIENSIRGTDLKLVVGNENRNFYVLIGSGSQSFPHAAEGYPAVMKDLKGMQIGVNALGATTHLMSNALLKGAGMTPDDVNYVADGSATTALAAWQAKRVDVQMAFTPFPEIVEALGNGRPLIDFSKGQGPKELQDLGGAFEGFSAKGSFIKEHPEIVDDFIKAHTDAIAWMKDKANHEKLVAIVNTYVNVAVIPEEKRKETVEKMIENYSSYLGVSVDRASIEAWNRYLLDNKLIDHPVKATDMVYAGAPKP
ncbi:MAG: ABC transporter substrate-binding protein [Hyphomicrobiales bacterium]